MRPNDFVPLAGSCYPSTQLSRKRQWRNLCYGIPEALAFLKPDSPSGHFLMGTSGVVENVDIINDDVLPATEPRRDTYIHVFCDLLPGEVACDHGPFAQPRIDNLIELRDRKVTGSFGADIIECHKPVIANGVHNLIVTVPEMVDYLTPSDESAASAQAGPCFRIDMDRRMGLEEAGDTTGKVGLSRAAPSQEGKPSRSLRQSPSHGHNP